MTELTHDIDIINENIGIADLYFYTNPPITLPIQAIWDDKESIANIIKENPDVKVLYRPYGRHEDPDYRLVDTAPIKFKIVGTVTKSLRFSAKWVHNKGERVEGHADYSKLRFFMPKWSTAYKFPWANHSKIMEPVFDRVLSLGDTVADHLKGNSDTKASRLFKRGNLQPIPKANLKHLFNLSYTTNSWTKINITKDFPTVYLKHRLGLGARPSDSIRAVRRGTKVLVQGLIKGSIVEEEVVLNGKNWRPLVNRFDVISNIASDTDDEILVANKLPLEQVVCLERYHSNVTVQGQTITYQKGKEKQAFGLPLFEFDAIYIDPEDHVTVVVNKNVYTSKLDLKLNLQLPKDISYNNSVFFECVQAEDGSYDLDLMLHNYASHVKGDLIAVQCLSSTGEKGYLDESFKFVLTDTPIYLNTELVQRADRLSLNLSVNDEWLVIRMVDYNNLHAVSYALVQPKLELFHTLELEDDESLVIVDGKHVLIKDQDPYYYIQQLEERSTSFSNDVLGTHIQKQKPTAKDHILSDGMLLATLTSFASLVTPVTVLHKRGNVLNLNDETFYLDHMTVLEMIQTIAVKGIEVSLTDYFYEQELNSISACYVADFELSLYKSNQILQSPIDRRFYDSYTDELHNEYKLKGVKAFAEGTNAELPVSEIEGRFYVSNPFLGFHSLTTEYEATKLCLYLVKEAPLLDIPSYIGATPYGYTSY